MTNTRRKADIVPSRTITNAGEKEPYSPSWVPVRPGSQDHEKVPSLQFGQRRFRDGRREQA